MPLDKVRIRVKNADLAYDLVRWEQVYSRYWLYMEQYADTKDPNIRACIDEMGEDLDIIEMELQSSLFPLF